MRLSEELARVLPVAPARRRRRRAADRAPGEIVPSPERRDSGGGRASRPADGAPERDPRRDG